MKKPPAVATALLIRLGPDNDCVIGDLLEEYAAGYSRAWYWRQVLAVTVTTVGVQVGGRRLRALSAAAIEWATLVVTFTVLGNRDTHSSRRFRSRVRTVTVTVRRQNCDCHSS